MTDARKLITPHTKVGELLEQFPELESVLISLAPPFSKLRNPILRRTVAKVTSLSQAARVGGIPVGELVQKLRQAAGQPDYAEGTDVGASTAGQGDAPSWFDRKRVVVTLDARPLIERGEQPMGQVMRELGGLQPGDIYELVTPFEPAPLIDLATGKGFAVWGQSTSNSEYRTYFRKP